MRAGVVLVALLSAFALGASGAGGESGIKGDGQLKSEPREVAGFTAIDSNVAADIDVTVGEAAKVTVETDGNLLPHLTTRVENGSLKIRADAEVRPTKGVKVHVSLPSLEAVTLGGAGKFGATKVDSRSLTVTMAGATNVTLEGKADVLTVKLSGAGNVVATGLVARLAAAELNGAGNIKVNATDELTATIGGAGNITYKGSPKVTSLVTGAGRVKGE